MYAAPYAVMRATQIHIQVMASTTVLLKIIGSYTAVNTTQQLFGPRFHSKERRNT
jgi:hypothetical protein